MKMLMILIISVLVLAVPAVYLIIPQHIDIRDSITIGCTKEGAIKILQDSSKWQQWWPGKASGNGTYDFRNISYEPYLKNYNGFAIKMQNKSDSMNCTLIVLPYNRDSITIFWQGAVTTGANPLQRISSYRSAKAYAANMHPILEHLKNYLQQTKNIYNITIEKGLVKDTLLINTKATFTKKPSTEDIYNLVYKLRKAIITAGSAETNFPMLNITNDPDSAHYFVSVAIPVRKPVTEENGITVKRMVAGNILISDDIRGGAYTVTTAFKAMETYVSDYQKMSPAIPFQSLITDRMAEPDTTKWITRIYYPIAY